MEQYLENTTVHGFAYLQRKNSLISKLFWFLIIITFFTFAAYLIYQAFEDWSENQTITTISSIATPIQESQFPTVTVCQNPETSPDVWSFLEKLFSQVPLGSGKLSMQILKSVLLNSTLGYPNMAAKKVHHLGIYEVRSIYNIVSVCKIVDYLKSTFDFPLEL